MKTDALLNAEYISRKTGYTFIGTADQHGIPHLSLADPMCVSGPDIHILAWNCPGTLRNLEINRNCVIICWDPASDVGYQICGRVEVLQQLGMIDGYIPEKDDSLIIPQTQWRMSVRFSSITDFKRSPHTDQALV